VLLKLLRGLMSGERTGRSTPKDSAGEAKAPSLAARGWALFEANRLTEARVALEQALSANSSDPDILLPLTAVYAQLGELASAHRMAEAALRLIPSDARVYDAMGNVLRLEGHLEDAIESYRRALLVDPRCASAMSNCALCLQDLGLLEQAKAMYASAIATAPTDLTAASNFATLMFDLGEFEAGMARLDAILNVRPDFAHAHLAKALALLRRGEFDRGWAEYEWRDRDAGRLQPSPSYPEWDGTPVAHGGLLVCAEQGLGDQIMFASCLEDLSPIAPGSIVECDPRLVGLFARSFPELRAYPHRRKDEEPWRLDDHGPVAKTWIGSLPARFRRNRKDFPTGKGHLRADPAGVEGWSKRLAALGDGLKIGISWRGGSATTRRVTRSIGLEHWGPILSHPGVHFVSLQYGDCTEEIAGVTRARGLRISHWEEAIRDCDETAALVCALDLVVSVQTSVAHLAGALGKRVWVLVPRVAEWRYGESGETMPWYPSARLFRQQGHGWDGTLLEVAGALRALSAGTRQERI
jgi:Tfp pilus assembly protein PilF